MARGFKVSLSFWLLAACLATALAAASNKTVPEPTPTSGNETSTTATPKPTLNTTTSGNETSTTTTLEPTTTATTSGNETSATTTPVPTTTMTTSGNKTSATTLTVPTSTATTSGNETSATTPTVPTTTTTTSENKTSATTTPVPTSNTTTSGNETSATTPTVPTSNTTTSGNETSATTTPVPTTATDPCLSNPCGVGSTCQPRFEDYECLCLTGDFYNTDMKRCERAKVFPGGIQLPDIEFIQGMNDSRSPIFIETSRKITEALKATFSSRSDYLGSVVLKIERESNTSGRERAGTGIIATVQMSFSPSSTITTSDVETEIKDSAASGLANANFTETKLCDLNSCDGDTTDCISADGEFHCSCKPGYLNMTFTNRICIACPSGEKADASGCIPCPFGYSGFNCNESWQLILVIVGSVLGGLLLIAVISLSIVSTRSSKRSKRGNNGVLEYSRPTQAPLVNGARSESTYVNDLGNANGGLPKIPRAQTNIEMTPSNRDPYYSVIQPKGSLYAQSNRNGESRPQSNPYAESRSQSNPYASRQGQTNPYFVNDDGRRPNY